MVAKMHLRKMVDTIDRQFPLEPYVKEAFLAIDRQAFVPTGFKHMAYQLDALPMQEQQWISSPLTVAKMTQHLELEGVDSVLEVGCGSGYQAAILALAGAEVFSIEIVAALAVRARADLKRLGVPRRPFGVGFRVPELDRARCRPLGTWRFRMASMAAP